jgi:hypothetical protein
MSGFYYYEAIMEINDRLISMRNELEQLRSDFYYFYNRIYVGDNNDTLNDVLVEKINAHETTIRTLWFMIMVLLALNIGTIFFSMVR